MKVPAEILRSAKGGDLLSSQLPITFETTGFVFNGFDVLCDNCGRMATAKDFQAKVKVLLKSVIEIDAVNTCPACQATTVIRFRVTDDGRCIFCDNDGWHNDHDPFSRTNYVLFYYRHISKKFVFIRNRIISVFANIRK